MPKIDLKLAFPVLACMVVIGFDVLVFSGWALSGICLVWGIYRSIQCFLRPGGAAGFPSIRYFIFFGMTTVSGYSLDAYVQNDFLQFAKNSVIPESRDELLKFGESRLSWVSKWLFVSYTNVDGKAAAKLRMFPYRIAEYDFTTGKFSTRPYD